MVDKPETNLKAGGSEEGMFPTTHWNIILAAGDHASPHAEAALETLCQAYWYPLYAFVRHLGHAPPDAQDLVQAFFARLLEKRDLAKAQPGLGRFRSYLLTALRHFLANEWDRDQAAKRGGGWYHLQLDQALAERQYHHELAHEQTAETIYERSWAWTVLDRVQRRLEEEFSAADQSQRFNFLNQFLPGQEPQMTYAEVAAQLGLSDGAIKGAVHRLRQRYGSLLREEIAKTVAAPGEIAEEIRHLIAALGG